MKTIQGFIETYFPYEPGKIIDLDERTILVSGAGGSIGSVLVNHLITKTNTSVVAVEQDEWRLIHLQETCYYNTRLYPVLGSVYDPNIKQSLFRAYPIDCFVHTASYKHVSFWKSKKKPSSITIFWKR